MKEEISGEWFRIKDVDSIDSPALVIYLDRVKQNIETLLHMIDDVDRLRPHVKTSKSKEACELLLERGIRKFKCATIAEAEMLGSINAPDVLLAYQLVPPKINRFIQLIKAYPATTFSCLVDAISISNIISQTASTAGVKINVFLDLNVGMNRTGIPPGSEAIRLYQNCAQLEGITPVGLHVYDGHIRDIDFKARTEACNKAFAPVENLRTTLLQKGFEALIIVAGGSPTFPVHAARENVECSPGTFIYWDEGYGSTCKEQAFVSAALVVSRTVSMPSANTLCLDLGHKSVAPENELARRVLFLNAPDLKFISQSEEHLVIETIPGHKFQIGDVLYGVPYHICPTCALYEKAFVVENNKVKGEWKTIARNRKLSI